MSLDGGLSAECADVFGVLSDFHLLDLLSEGGTISEIQKIVSTLLIFRFFPPSNPLRAVPKLIIFRRVRVDFRYCAPGCAQRAIDAFVIDLLHT